MQRLSSLVTLFLFMLMLSWVAQALQEDPELLRTQDQSRPFTRLPPQAQLEPGHEQERITLLDRNGADLPEPDESGLAELAEPEAPGEEHLLASHPEQVDRGAPQITDGIHFLLVGRSWESPAVELLMVVTLVPGRCAHLTSVDPNLPAPEPGGAAAALGELLERGGNYTALIEAVTAVTGMEPRFYIDLNRDGFIAMIELLGGLEYSVSPRLAEAAPLLEPGANHLDGNDLLLFLENPEIKTADKESLLVVLLINARDVQDTQVGLSLLWTGYRNIRTDLGLGDLLELRSISQQISPTRVTLTEIKMSD